MSRLLVKHMASKGLKRLTILNRSLPRVEALKEEFPEVEFDVHLMPDLMQCISDCDTIFAASGSEDILVHKEHLAGEIHAGPAIFSLHMQFLMHWVPQISGP